MRMIVHKGVALTCLERCSSNRQAYKVKADEVDVRVTTDVNQIEVGVAVENGALAAVLVAAGSAAVTGVGRTEDATNP